MWVLTVRVADQSPVEYVLEPGRTTIGRKKDNDIPINDNSASRLHAVIFYDLLPGMSTLTLSDVGSTNGTYVNRERLSGEKRLQPGDVIRIGGSTLTISTREAGEKPAGVSGARPFTRELVLESVDHHAVLMYEAAQQLNTVMNIDAALEKVSGLLKKAMGADRCEVILAQDFERMPELGFPASIAKNAIEQRSAVVIPDLMESDLGKHSGSASLLHIRSVLCVPVMTGEEVAGLIYMYKTEQNDRPFDQQDLQLAVAISHQTSLTIQRMELISQVQREQRGRELLERFVAPEEAKFMLQEYLRAGSLPPLAERDVSVLFVDMVNSTGLSERLGAEGFGELLNRYYWDLTDIIFEYSGLVKYAGDGILAIFGMMGEAQNHCEQAVRAALTILDHIEAVQFYPEVETVLGLGVNTGLVMIGYVGTQQRVELTALGYVVNVAYDLQRSARPNRLLVGPATAFGVAGTLPLIDRGFMQVKGSTAPLHIYEVSRQEGAVPLAQPEPATPDAE